MQQVSLSSITPQTVSYFEQAARAIKENSPSWNIWTLNGAGATGNHIQFPIYKFFNMPEPKSWRVELELIRIKCVALFVIKNKIVPASDSRIGYIAASGFFFDEIRRISQEAESFEVAKGHYQCLIAYLFAA